MASPQRLPTTERRRQLAEAALHILSTGGVRRLTAAALAKEIGIADGTIFRHFESMSEIVEAAIEHFASLIEATFPPPEGEPLDRLRRFVIARLELVRRRPEILRLAFNDRLAEAAGEEGADRVEELVQRSLSFIGDCLEKARGRGELADGVPLTMLVWMVVGVLRGGAMERRFRVQDESPLCRATPEEIWTALESALRNASGRER